MRVDMPVPSPPCDDQLRFHVGELALFTVAHGYGLGYVVLRHVPEPWRCRMLDPDRPPSPRHPVFGLSVRSCRDELARLSTLSLAKGGLVLGPDGATAVPD